jgi:hypothetical protein
MQELYVSSQRNVIYFIVFVLKIDLIIATMLIRFRYNEHLHMYVKILLFYVSFHLKVLRVRP